jgi:hypothetical protein
LNPQRIGDEEFHADPVFIPETWVRSTFTTDTGNQATRNEGPGQPELSFTQLARQTSEEKT